MGAVSNREVTRKLIQESRLLKAQLQMVRTDVQWLVEQQQELRARATELADFTDMLRVSETVLPAQVRPANQARPAEMRGMTGQTGTGVSSSTDSAGS